MQYQHLILTRLHSVLAIFKSDSLALTIPLKRIKDKRAPELEKSLPVTDHALSYRWNMLHPPGLNGSFWSRSAKEMAEKFIVKTKAINFSIIFL